MPENNILNHKEAYYNAISHIFEKTERRYYKDNSKRSEKVSFFSKSVAIAGIPLFLIPKVGLPLSVTIEATAGAIELTNQIVECQYKWKKLKPAKRQFLAFTRRGIYSTNDLREYVDEIFQDLEVEDLHVNAEDFRNLDKLADYYKAHIKKSLKDINMLNDGINASDFSDESQEDLTCSL